MPIHRHKLLSLCIAASLLSGLSVETAAIGVGEIHLQSFLGAPLQAEVPLSHLGDLSADQFKVQLGTQDDYTAMNVDYTYLHSQLKIEPIIKNGQGYVRISTREPITEPYVNFVLNLRWPQGQLVREFTVLLDPPAPAVAAAAVPQSEVAANSGVIADAVAPASAAAAPHRRQHRHATTTSAAPAESPAAESGGRYVIQRGDSLWRIANRLRPAQVPVEQMMMAIHALNPRAFVNGNPNLLKEATTLALPDAQQVVSATGVDSPVAGAEPVRKATAKAVEKTTAPSEAPAVAQLAEENSELKSQVADLTSNVVTLNQNLAQSEQHLHQLESQLNELIQQMQQQRATVATLSGATEMQSAPLAQSTGSVINQVNAADLHGPAQARTPWWVHLLYWLGIGGAMTWAVREHFWPQRRLAAASVGGVVVPGYAAVPVPAAPIAPRTSTGAPNKIKTVADAAGLTLDLDELPVSAAAASVESFEPAPHLIQTRDEHVDPSISAGVFVAFGRFGEAEDLLRNALAREPARIDLKLQLLDVLMQSDQPGAFDDLAAEIESEAHAPEMLAELAVLRDSYRPRH